MYKIEKLSPYKIQLEYSVPIETKKGVFINYMKLKTRYLITPSTLNMIWLKDKFINQVSVKYGIKKKNIYFHCLYNKEIGTDKFNMIIDKIIFNDIKWERDLLINKLIKK